MMPLFRCIPTDKWADPMSFVRPTLKKTDAYCTRATKTKNNICTFEGCQTVLIKYVINPHVEHVGVQCPDCLLSETCLATLDHRGGTPLPCGHLSVSSSMFRHVTPCVCDLCEWFHQFRE